jgi:hypothetical protein
LRFSAADLIAAETDGLERWMSTQARRVCWRSAWISRSVRTRKPCITKGVSSQGRSISVTYMPIATASIGSR